MGAANLGNGYTVYASGPVYPYVVPQTINGRTQNPVSTYPMDTAIELVELTTGNHYTYSQIKNVLVGKDGKGRRRDQTRDRLPRPDSPAEHQGPGLADHDT